MFGEFINVDVITYTTLETTRSLLMNSLLGQLALDHASLLRVCPKGYYCVAPLSESISEAL